MKLILTTFIHLFERASAIQVNDAPVVCIPSNNVCLDASNLFKDVRRSDPPGPVLIVGTSRMAFFAQDIARGRFLVDGTFLCKNTSAEECRIVFFQRMPVDLPGSLVKWTAQSFTQEEVATAFDLAKVLGIAARERCEFDTTGDTPEDSLILGEFDIWKAGAQHGDGTIETRFFVSAGESTSGNHDTPPDVDNVEIGHAAQLSEALLLCKRAIAEHSAEAAVQAYFMEKDYIETFLLAGME